MGIEGKVNQNETKLSLEGDKWTLRTDFEDVEEAVDEAVRRAVESGWENDITLLEWSLRETLVNAAVHGNGNIKEPAEGEKNWGKLLNDAIKNDPSIRNKRILMEVSISPEKLYFRIKDEGEGFFPVSDLDIGTEEAQKKTNSRGIATIKMFFDSVEFRGPGNDVILIKEKNKKDVISPDTTRQ
jgi:hypothetical protein